MSPMARGLAFCTLAAVAFGASAPFVVALTDAVPSVTLAGLLYLGAALGTGPLALHPASRPAPQAWRRSAVLLGLAVVFGGALGPVLLVLGLANTSAASGSLLLNFELVATTILAGVMFSEYIGPKIMSGVTLVTAAGVVLGWSGNPEIRWGAILIAAACVCWGVDNCVTASIDGITASQVTAVKGVLAGGATFAVGVGATGLPELVPSLGALAVGAIAYGLSSMWWVIGARDLGAARGQLVFSSAPFVGAVLSWVGFGESIEARQLVALGLAGVGVALVVGSQHEHAHYHPAVEHTHRHSHDEHHTHEHTGDEPPLVGGVHEHLHRQEAFVHTHPHLPDLHHKHDHGSSMEGKSQ